MLNFKYVFYIVADKNYGSFKKETKRWNGLVKDLLDRVSLVLSPNSNGSIFTYNLKNPMTNILQFQKADLAICDLTITYERRSAVDFTSPFMTLGN